MSKLPTGPAWVNSHFRLPELVDGALVGPRLPGHRRIRRAVSASFWTEHGRCPTAAKLSRIDKLEPEYVHRALDVGRLYHDVFGAFWTADNGQAIGSDPDCYSDPHGAADLTIDAWWHSQRDRLEAAEPGEANYDIARLDAEAAMVRAMVNAWAKLPRLHVVALEVPFRVAIPGPSGRDIGLDVHGIFDALVADGRVIPWELKGSRGSIADYESEIDGNPQATIYGYAAGQIFGATSSGVIWDAVAKKIPSVPKLLVCKKGPCAKRRAAIAEARTRLVEIETDVFGLDAEAAPIRALIPTPYTPAIEAPWGCTTPRIPMDGEPGCAVCGGSGVIGLSVSEIDTTAELVELSIAALAAVSPAGREAAEAGEYESLRAQAGRAAEKFATRFFRHPAREQIAELPGELRALDSAWRWEQKTGVFPRNRGNCRQIGRVCSFLPICPPYGPEAFEGFRTKEA